MFFKKKSHKRKPGDSRLSPYRQPLRRNLHVRVLAVQKHGPLDEGVVVVVDGALVVAPEAQQTRDLQVLRELRVGADERDGVIGAVAGFLVRVRDVPLERLGV